VMPSAATGSVTVTDDEGVVGSATLTDGEATVDIAAGLLGVGGHTLTLEYSGDGTFASSTGQVVVTVLPLGATTTNATADDIVYGTDGAVEVTVGGGPLTGSVQVLDGASVLDEADLAADGTATLTIPGTALAVGDHTLSVEYSGDDEHAASATTVEVGVVKATPTMTVTTTPSRVTTKDAIALRVALDAPGQVVTGTVALSVDGRNAVGTLVNGAVTFHLSKFTKAGTYQVTLTYGGSALANAVTRTVPLEVLKR
jgi:hypothetical protein